MTEIIAISTNKGGVLKTTLTTCLAGVMAKDGKKVLIIDTDNQGDVSLTFGKNPDAFELTLYDILVDWKSPNMAIQNVYENIDLLPSNDDMAFLEFDVLSNPKKFKDPFRLMQMTLEPYMKKYDFVLIDTPPNLGLVQGNVLAFADQVIVPFQPESYSMRSLVKILNFMDDFKEKFNPMLKVLGIAGTLVDSRTILHSQIMQECRKYAAEHGLTVFDTIIPKSIKSANSVAYEQLPATLSDAKHPMIQNYYKLYQEVKNHE